jgi:hypothetical protein
VLALLLFFMGIIYIKTDLFYANPSLALLGFHMYIPQSKQIKQIIGITISVLS